MTAYHRDCYQSKNRHFEFDPNIKPIKILYLMCYKNAWTNGSKFLNRKWCRFVVTYINHMNVLLQTKKVAVMLVTDSFVCCNLDEVNCWLHRIDVDNKNCLLNVGPLSFTNIDIAPKSQKLFGVRLRWHFLYHIKQIKYCINFPFACWKPVNSFPEGNQLHDYIMRCNQSGF